MIVGIGTDLIEIERIDKACEREHFRNRIFTTAELQMITGDAKKAAGNFAVKESVVKMFGTGFGSISPADIEVLRNKLGKPYVQLYGKAREMADSLKIERIHVSITNTKEYASAFVVGEGEGLE